MNKQTLLGLGLACYLVASNVALAANSGENIGRVIISTTNLIAKQTDGSTRALRNTSPIYEGDTIITGDEGMAQLRLVDGSLFSLRKKTEFQVAEYRFSLRQQANEGGLFNLLRGGFRTITGLLGKRPNSDYQVKTSAATIGIRGTHYGLRLCQNGDCIDDGIQQDGLYGGVVDGEIFAENQYGSSSFGNDEYFFVQGWSSQAKGMIVPPGVIFGADKVNSGKQRNNRETSANTNSASGSSPENRQRVRNELRKIIRDNHQQGENLNASQQLSMAPEGTQAALAMLMDCCGPAIKARTETTIAKPGNSTGSGKILLTPDKKIAAATRNIVGSPSHYFEATQNSKSRDIGSIAALGVSWGRWEKNWDGYTGTSTESPLKTSSAHYIMSNKVQAIVDLPTGPTGVIIFGSVIGGTRPTDHLSNKGQITNLSVNVDFGSQTIRSFNLDMRFMANETVNLNLDPTSAVMFKDAMNGGLALTGKCKNGRCGGVGIDLKGNASVHFLGAGAPALMTAFSASDKSTGKVGYTGTAVLNRLPESPITP